MPNDFRNSYRVLGLHPGVSWKQLRQTYKKLINAWHPDRFPQDPQRQKLAEEKTKEITQAYKELEAYHKSFGVLPLSEPEATIAVSAPEPVQPSPPQADAEPEPSGAERSTSPEDLSDKDKFRLRRRYLATASLLILGTILIWSNQTPEHPETSKAPPGSKIDSQAVGTETPAPPPKTPFEEKRFAVGSSLGDVYAIQGVPTRTEGDVWYYGKSKIYFSKGKVLRWEEDTDTPLRADIMQGFVNTRATFGRGSTKKEVRDVLGAPDRDNGDSWDYGLSRVYFENDRVKGWQESPINPLRVRR